MATISQLIKDNTAVLLSLYEGHAEQVGSSYDSLYVTTILKANVRGILYDLKLHQTRGMIGQEELIELQSSLAKILVSMMHHYLGELNSNPYIDTFFFNIFYDNLTFEIEDYFEVFSTFKDDSISLDDDYVKAFKTFSSIDLNEHTTHYSHYQNIHYLFASHQKALTDWLVSFSQIYLTFKLINEHAHNEGHIMPCSCVEVEKHFKGILEIFKDEIKSIKQEDIYDVVRRNYGNFIAADSFENLYLEADEDDLSDEINHDKLNPETQEAIKMFHIFWEKDDDSFPSMLKGTYLLAWADLIVKDTSTQRNKVIAEYGPFLEHNKEAIAAMKAFSFGEDVFEKHRSESYNYID